MSTNLEFLLSGIELTFTFFSNSVNELTGQLIIRSIGLLNLVIGDCDCLLGSMDLTLTLEIVDLKLGEADLRGDKRGDLLDNSTDWYFLSDLLSILIWDF